MPSSLRNLALSVAAVALAAPVLSAASSTADTSTDGPPHQPSLRLPQPTGPAPVGTTSLHLVDRSRPDPWVPSAGHRELMVSMFYPSWVPLGHPSEYTTPAESAAFVEGQRDLGVPVPEDIPDDILSTVRTNATADALPAPRPGGRPLIVLSPGFSLSRSSLTGLATELASDGYVVATVDHTYESFGTSLPGGRFATCVACDIEDYSKVPRGRAKDISFVLNRLLSRRAPWQYARMIDEDRIGIAGHSIGGNSAATAMAADPRIDAGVNLDGTFFEPVRERLSRPFMLLGTAELHTPAGEDESWPRDWQQLTGPRYWLTVEESGHFSFIDYPALTEQLGIENPTSLTGRRSMRITRAYVDAFFDRHLRGRQRPLLDCPSPRFGEVDFHRP